MKLFAPNAITLVSDRASGCFTRVCGQLLLILAVAVLGSGCIATNCLWKTSIMDKEYFADPSTAVTIYQSEKDPLKFLVIYDVARKNGKKGMSVKADLFLYEPGPSPEFGVQGAARPASMHRRPREKQEPIWGERPKKQRLPTHPRGWGKIRPLKKRDIRRLQALDPLPLLTEATTSSNYTGAYGVVNHGNITVHSGTNILGPTCLPDYVGRMKTLRSSLTPFAMAADTAIIGAAFVLVPVAVFSGNIEGIEGFASGAAAPFEATVTAVEGIAP